MYFSIKLSALFALVCVCVARPQQYEQPAAGGGYAQEQGMPYNFEWVVNDPESGNDYSHRQSSDGQVTQGEYRVLLPDGRLQIVTFVDNGNGFEADVKYEGEAQYPEAAASNGGYGSQTAASNYGPPQRGYGGQQGYSR